MRSPPHLRGELARRREDHRVRPLRLELLRELRQPSHTGVLRVRTQAYSEYSHRRVLSPGEMRLDRGRAGGGGAPGYVHEHGEDERARLARTGLGDADHVLRGPRKDSTQRAHGRGRGEGGQGAAQRRGGLGASGGTAANTRPSGSTRLRKPSGMHAIWIGVGFLYPSFFTRCTQSRFAYYRRYPPGLPTTDADPRIASRASADFERARTRTHLSPSLRGATSAAARRRRGCLQQVVGQARLLPRADRVVRRLRIRSECRTDMPVG